MIAEPAGCTQKGTGQPSSWLGCDGRHPNALGQYYGISRVKITAKDEVTGHVIVLNVKLDRIVDAL